MAWGMVGAAFLALFAIFPYFEGYDSTKIPLVNWIWHGWNSFQGEWQHGMLVPFIIIFLIYRDWEKLKQIPWRTSPWALSLILVSLFCFWFGYVGCVEYFGYLSLYLFLIGIVLWFGGSELFHLLLFPLTFLIFLFPLPFLDNIIAYPLRIVMSQGSHLILLAIGIDNLQIGTAVISAPNLAKGLARGDRFAIDVADPCSGIHSLFALIMLTTIYAHITFNRTWKKWLLFLAAIPLAVIGNMARIIILTIGTIFWGSRFTIGTEEHPTWFHMTAGFAVFVVALGGIILLAKVLQKSTKLNIPSNAVPKKRPAYASKALYFRHAGLLLALTLLTIGLCIITVPPTLMTQAGVKLELPPEVAGWLGLSEGMSKAERTLLPADTQIVRRNYTSIFGDNIICSIVLSGAERRSIHRPEICLPSQGWTVHSSNIIDVPLISGHSLKVMDLTLSRPILRMNGTQATLLAHYLYWFVGENVTTPNHWMRLWLTSWDRVVHHINHRWAYVIVMAPITEGLQINGKNSEQTLIMLKGFIANVTPYFQKSEMQLDR